MLSSPQYELPLRAQEAQYLLLNAGQMAMYRVKYSPGCWNDLLSNMDLLAPIDRLALLDNVLALAEVRVVVCCSSWLACVKRLLWCAAVLSSVGGVGLAARRWRSVLVSCPVPCRF